MMLAMTDQQVIQAAYEAAVTRLYANLVLGYTDAAGGNGSESQADQNFKTGLAIARRSRDSALTLVG